MTRPERRLSAIVAADIVGYSRLIEADEAATLAAITALRKQVIDPLRVEYKGRVIKLMGDRLIVEFASAVDAVLCDVAMQKHVASNQQEVSSNRRIIFRVGINLGDVVVAGEDNVRLYPCRRGAGARGIVFLVFFHRLVPERTRADASLHEAIDIKNYLSEAKVVRGSAMFGKTLGDLLRLSDKNVTVQRK